ncbi:hypothetical protein CAOG_03980 [Capsaspora owczarzaki ATCC 30864]|uniref:Uncharacterized protein n=1 Tax=Capsaspora owczarzaki (strain ATCC 30864) TaxID=595528 RepID=A0A0D2UDN6_CAPO3|nr:hypothetical protein CAOG_03980 [Capsaspora owczarzaki ATCC 30864]KJE93151.1 hypothetical protein CAOG_003980 [Capsaspora owczarzaki ATCC 30864]|eukprot:XP_004347805.1 hypothetical protein CAOG_03980 [Capsaspora owczarzaki ATCC 30864]
MPSQDSNFFWRHIGICARIFGLLTVVALWGTGIAEVGDHLGVGAYTICAGIVMTIIEGSWVLQKCACCNAESCIYKTYFFLVNLRGWIKFILYALMSIVCFIETTWCIVGGVMLDVDAVFYLLSSFVSKKEGDAAAKDESKPEEKRASLRDPNALV